MISRNFFSVISFSQWWKLRKFSLLVHSVVISQIFPQTWKFPWCNLGFCKSIFILEPFIASISRKKYPKFAKKIVGEILWNYHTVQCGNYGNSLSLFFGKNFVKLTVLLKQLTKELIWRNIFFGEREFLAFPQCDVASSNFFSKNVTFTKFCQKSESKFT